MAVTISPEDLSDAVQAALEEYGDLAKEVTRDTVRKVAKTCRQEIRAASPYRTGRYSKGWRVKETASPNGDVTETVYNASAPGLTHLLEAPTPTDTSRCTSPRRYRRWSWPSPGRR